MQSARSLISRHGAAKANGPLLAVRPLQRPDRISLRRSYATVPNQEQVFQSFTTPLAQFLFTISRIARIVLYTGGGFVAVCGITYEGVHQYVEHVAMPNSQVKLNERGGKDVWGWVQDIDEDNWGEGRGTDPRLGFRGRHTLRSAWICAHWGGGISPSAFVSPGAGIPRLGGKPSSTANFAIEEGLDKAEVFLKETLSIAEEKGIRIPDLAAIRAGIHSPNAIAANKPLDWTAVALENKLASIRERLGSREALKGALSGYTRIFDVLAHVDATNRSMKSEGHESGQPHIRTERLVKLATKVGDLHTFLGQRAEAEDWLLLAVSLAGHKAGEVGEESGREGLVRNQILTGVGGLSNAPAEIKEAKMAVKGQEDKNPLARISPSSNLLSSQAPSPALTRLLISTLLSLSAFYAQPNDRTQLEKALQFQASALRLTRVEKKRLALSDKKSEISPQLHLLWLTHHDALASVHIAETVYALGSRGQASASFSKLFTTLGLSSPQKDKHAQTLEWLSEADQSAKFVASQLIKTIARRPDEEAQLQKKWTGDIEIETPAKRLLRDSIRLKLTVEDMRKALAS